MADPDAQGEDVFQVERIRNLVELMREYDLREIDLRQTNQRIRLCRGLEASAPVVLSAPAGPALPSPPRPLVPATPQSAAAVEPVQVASEPANIAYVRSPMVGTFYSRPNPKAEPYVRLGDLVSPESVVCVIEAMKVFNEIPAEVRGRVVAVLVDDEEPVEFGKPLFKVETGA
jgi:acetyl-CoA carboxylase biotin carboxyl carrier protein